MDFCLDVGFVSLIKIPGTSKEHSGCLWTDLLNIYILSHVFIVSCHAASLFGVQPYLKSAAILPAFVNTQKQTPGTEGISQGDLHSVISRDNAPSGQVAQMTPSVTNLADLWGT